MIILANSAWTHESHHDRIFLPEISRAQPRHQRTSSFFDPSLPQTPSFPDARYTDAEHTVCLSPDWSLLLAEREDLAALSPF
jgi:hypothetical protein